MMKILILSSAMICLLLSCGYAEQDKTPPAGKKEYVFKGMVEKIDASNKTFAVKNEKIEGWMEAMTMNYAPDKEDVLEKVKVGDEITAKVYDGDYRTLYDVQVVAKGEDEKEE